MQLEGHLLNVRKLPASMYRGEGVGAASSPSNTELVTKAIQDMVDVDEGWYLLANLDNGVKPLLSLEQWSK